MKNVLIIENSSKFYWGGGQQITLMVIKILKDRVPGLFLADYESEMLFPKLADQYIDKDHTVRLYGKCYKNPLTHKESKIIELLTSFATLPINTYNLVRFCKRNSLTPDNTIVYCITKKVLLITYFFSIITKFKYIYHSHMVVNSNGIDGRMMMKELKKAEKILCVSRTVEKTIPYNNKILLYNALDYQGEIYKIKTNKFVVSVVGSIVPVKGFDVFVNSYKYLKHKEDVEYRIYGTGYLEDDLREQISKVGDSAIMMMGFKKNILKELTESNVLVVPTVIKESFSLVVLQSFLIGIPCIATNIGGQAENIIDGKNGFLVPVNDAKSIAERIDFLITHPAEYDKISEEAKRTYNRFSYNNFENQVVNIFSNL